MAVKRPSGGHPAPARRGGRGEAQRQHKYTEILLRPSCLTPAGWRPSPSFLRFLCECHCNCLSVFASPHRFASLAAHQPPRPPLCLYPTPVSFRCCGASNFSLCCTLISFFSRSPTFRNSCFSFFPLLFYLLIVRAKVSRTK